MKINVSNLLAVKHQLAEDGMVENVPQSLVGSNTSVSTALGGIK